MSNISRTRNPLSHNGTSQYERLLEALTPEYFKIDDRSLKDLLHATFQYSKTLVYYNEANQDQGDWTCFWKVEMLTFLANLSTIDAEKVLRDYEKIKEDFQTQLDAASGEDFTEKTNQLHLALIDYLRAQALQIEEAILYLPDTLPLSQEIIALVERDSITDTEQLASVLKTLIGFHKEAHQRSFEERLDSDTYKSFFKMYWGIPDKLAFYDIDHSDEYRFNGQEALDKLLKAFYQTLIKIKHCANFWFDRNLDSPQLRQPHVALFLTFLRLFNHARNSLNNLTKKHLEYYYEKILCLRKGAEVPDDAYLILELAATVDQHLVEEGTAFIGGQDANGSPLIFETIENWFLNQAQVKEIKTTYIDVNGILAKKDGSREKQILAASDVKIAYKNGEELPNDTYDFWRGMGDNIDLPNGEIGFAIASPQLILREGKRIIDVIFNIRQPVPDLNNSPYNSIEFLDEDIFGLRLSSEEEWQYLTNEPAIYFSDSDEKLGLEDPSFNIKIGGPSLEEDYNLYEITIRIVLEKDHLPVDALGVDLNEESGFNSEWPILHFLILPLRDSDQLLSAEIYQILREIKIDTITINVDVKDIQENLIIQSDQGVFDGTQKFYPFGPIPEIGDHFYIGSTEVFQKALSDLEITFDWIAPPEFIKHYQGYRNIDDRIKLLTPSLRIDFIDRAIGREASVPPRIDRSGSQQTNSDGQYASISGQVTDVTNVGIEGVEIRVNDISLDPPILTDAEGEYEIINNPPNLLLTDNTTLSFSFTDDLEPVPAPGENSIIIDESSTINIALYPKRVILLEKFEEDIHFRISELLTGRNLDDEEIILDPNANYDDTTKIHTLENLSPDGSNLDLRFIYLDSDENEMGWVKGTLNPLFPELDVRLLPLEIDSTSGSIDEIQLTIIDSDNEESLIFNVQIKVLDIDGDIVNDVDITTPTQLDGIYIISGSSIDLVDSLELSYADFLPLVIPSSQFAVAENIEVKHFIKRFSKKAFFFGVVYDSNVGGGPNSFDNVIILVYGTAIASQISNGGNYAIDQVPLDLGSVVLEIIFNNDYRREIALSNIGIEGSNEIDFLLFPTEVNTPIQEDSLETDQVRVIITLNGNDTGNENLSLSIDGNLDVDFTFSLSENKFTSSDFVIISETETINLKIELSGNTLVTIPVMVKKKHITQVVISEPKPTIIPSQESETIYGNISIFGKDVAQTNVEDELEIIVKSSSGIPLDPQPTVNIQPNSSYEISELESGSFGLVEYHLPNFRKVEVSATASLKIDVSLFSYPISNIIKGEITDVFNIPLAGVEVAIGDVDVMINNAIINQEVSGTVSNQNGVYEIFIPNNPSSSFIPKNLLFNLENFEVTEVEEIDYNSFSQINIVLYNTLNVFPLVTGNDEIRDTFDINIATLSLTRDVRTQEFTKYSAILRRGFLKMTLDKGDFLHDEYQNVLIKSTLQAAANIEAECVDPTTNDPIGVILPNPPYTPATNTIRLNYTSSQIITGEDNEGIDSYYHLYPFKGYDVVALDEPDICLLPQFDRPTFKLGEEWQLANGNLFIGLSNLKPGSNLSLLIQIQEGSEQNSDVAAPKVCWAYLAKDNEWKPLSESKILKDTTKSLRRTGIFQITTPKDMVSETTLFEGACYWLRAAIREEVEFNENGQLVNVISAAIGLPSIIDIRAQGILVQFKNNENDLSHLAQPLPAGEIGQLQISRSAVKGIEQPFSSFNGQLPEEGNMFYVRVSERLRHRDRAVHIYDYEHLLLEQFPKIQRAKCLNHTKPGTRNILLNTIEDVELAPGYVTIAVIPELKMRSGEAAAEPRFSQGDLEEMTEYLREKTNLFVAGVDKKGQPYLRVVNPLYEEVKLCFNVQFKIGEAPESRRFDLDLALKGYLAPWLYQEDHDITFGRTLNRSKIILFIEQLSYVDAISDFEMIHCGKSVQGNELIPTTSRSILTTVIDEDDNPDSTDHKIEPVDNICVVLEELHI